MHIRLRTAKGDIASVQLVQGSLSFRKRKVVPTVVNHGEVSIYGVI